MKVLIDQGNLLMSNGDSTGLKETERWYSHARGFLGAWIVQFVLLLDQRDDQASQNRRSQRGETSSSFL